MADETQQGSAVSLAFDYMNSENNNQYSFVSNSYYCSSLFLSGAITNIYIILLLISC